MIKIIINKNNKEINKLCASSAKTAWKQIAFV